MLDSAIPSVQPDLNAPLLEDSALSRVWLGFMTARIMIAMVLLAMQLSIVGMGQANSAWVLVFCLAYLVATVIARMTDGPRILGRGFDAHWLSVVGVDLIVFGVLQWTQLGGINYTPLFALPVLLASVLGSAPVALGTAAAVTLLLLADAWWMGLQGTTDSTARYLQSGLTGIGFFAVALLTAQLSARLLREEQEVRRSRVAARTQVQINELVMETLAEGVLVVDATGIVRVINPAARQLLGAGARVRSTPFVLAGESVWQPLAHLARSSFVDESSPVSELTLMHPGQHPHRLQVKARLTPGDGRGLDALCVMFLQDLRETEARIRTEKLAAMGRMSAAVAHEIRNPLAAITQANALLMEDLTGASAHGLARMVDKNAQRLARIVDEVLNLARVQDVTHRPEPSAIALDAVVQGAVAEWAAQSGSAQRLTMNLAAEGHAVEFEDEHLRRVLVNLLDNALRYASVGADAIQVATLVLTDEASVVAGLEVSVWSDGDPLDAGVQAHLFEPFFSSESRSSGLGLYICRELCERNGARITYRRGPRDGRDGNEFAVLCRASEISKRTLPLALDTMGML